MTFNGRSSGMLAMLAAGVAVQGVGGSPGPGASTWLRQDPKCSDGQELSLLKSLLKEITETKRGCWRCGQTREVFDNAKACSDACPKVRLGGAVVFKCFKLNTPDGEHRNRLGDQF